jgi:hypothetical protein
VNLRYEIAVVTAFPAGVQYLSIAHIHRYQASFINQIEQSTLYAC